MKYLFLILFISFHLHSQNSNEKTVSTSIIKLISNPEQFNNKPIRIIGFLHLEFEGNAIFLHKEDFENRNNQNAFYLILPSKLEEQIIKEKANNSYISLTGIYKMNQHGHLGLWPGEIIVESIEKIK